LKAWAVQVSACPQLAPASPRARPCHLPSPAPREGEASLCQRHQHDPPRPLYDRAKTRATSYKTVAFPGRPGEHHSSPGPSEPCAQTVPPGRPEEVMCEPLAGRAVFALVPKSPGRQVVSTLPEPRPQASKQTVVEDHVSMYTVPHLVATGGKDQPPVRVSCQRALPLGRRGLLVAGTRC